MKIENLIDLEINLRNIEKSLFEDKELFRVWLKVKLAREILGEHIRRGGSDSYLEPEEITKVEKN
jgi:hypothetical protein